MSRSYTPQKFQGIGIQNPYITMGLVQLVTIVKEGQAPSITGHLIWASIKTAKLELGIGFSLFTSDYKKFGMLAMDCWIVQSWKFFYLHGIEILEDTPTPPLGRIGDLYLIPAFLGHGFKGKELAHINRCRLFLQVTSLADIVSADGKHITHATWHGCKDSLRPSYYYWPNQGNPTPRDWQLWHRCLSLSFCGGQERRMVIPLGSWTNQQFKEWLWFYSPDEDRLYTRDNTIWQFYSVEGGRLQ
jgi:hypothetical protein